MRARNLDLCARCKGALTRHRPEFLWRADVPSVDTSEPPTPPAITRRREIDPDAPTHANCGGRLTTMHGEPARSIEPVRIPRRINAEPLAYVPRSLQPCVRTHPLHHRPAPSRDERVTTNQLATSNEHRSRAALFVRYHVEHLMEPVAQIHVGPPHRPKHRLASTVPIKTRVARRVFRTRVGLHLCHSHPNRAHLQFTADQIEGDRRARAPIKALGHEHVTPPPYRLGITTRPGWYPRSQRGESHRSEEQRSARRLRSATQPPQPLPRSPQRPKCK